MSLSGHHPTVNQGASICIMDMSMQGWNYSVMAETILQDVIFLQSHKQYPFRNGMVQINSL